MPVLDRNLLLMRRLAELHATASELGIERFRLLRKPDLADAILHRLPLRERATLGGAASADPPPRPKALARDESRTPSGCDPARGVR
jgi:transcription termination factor Rho